MRETIKIGVSSAASWAWGTSLVMGMMIAQEKGLAAFVIWAVANSLTLALIGALFKYNIIRPEVYRSKASKVIAIIIQMFCLIIQMNIINQILGTYIFSNPCLSYVATVVIGCVFVIAMYKKGLETSMFTDVFQWCIAMVGIVIICGLGLFYNVPKMVIPVSGESDILWGLWSACILFAGPIGDVQHWQRCEADKSKNGYYWGAAFFWLYMLLVLRQAQFQFNDAMGMVLLVITLCVTTSTIDSIAVAMHELGNKKIGTIISLVICVFWGVFVNTGIIALWSNFGVVRVAYAVLIVAASLYLNRKRVANHADN